LGRGKPLSLTKKGGQQKKSKGVRGAVTGVVRDCLKGGRSKPAEKKGGVIHLRRKTGRKKGEKKKGLGKISSWGVWEGWRGCLLVKVSPVWFLSGLPREGQKRGRLRPVAGREKGLVG